MIVEPGQEANYENAIAIGCGSTIRDGGRRIRSKWASHSLKMSLHMSRWTMCDARSSMSCDRSST
jgi:hypothetical protein